MGSGGPRGYAWAAVTLAPPRRLLAIAALAGLGLTAAACQSTSPYAVIVNGTRISQDHLRRELQSVKNNKAFVDYYDQAAAQSGRAPVLTGGTASPTFSSDFTAVLLTNDVEGELVHAEVVRRHLEPDPAAIAGAKAKASQGFGQDQSGKPLFDGFDPWFQQLWQQRQAESDALKKSLPTKPVDDAAIKNYYDANPASFITNQCVSHILVKTKAEADAIRAKIVAGADFAVLAKQSSIDTGSGAKGGDLGCSAPGQFVQQFEQVADTVPIGQLSDPVQTQFGYHVIKVTNRTVAPFDDNTKAAIKQRLQQQNNPLAPLLQGIVKAAKIQVNPAYGRWDTQKLLVVPPTPPATSTTVPTGAGTGGPAGGGTGGGSSPQGQSSPSSTP